MGSREDYEKLLKRIHPGTEIFFAKRVWKNISPKERWAFSLLPEVIGERTLDTVTYDAKDPSANGASNRLCLFNKPPLRYHTGGFQPAPVATDFRQGRGMGIFIIPKHRNSPPDTKAPFVARMASAHRNRRPPNALKENWYVKNVHEMYENVKRICNNGLPKLPPHEAIELLRDAFFDKKDTVPAMTACLASGDAPEVLDYCKAHGFDVVHGKFVGE